MKTKTMIVISLVLILGVILAGVLLWNKLPDQMASHWNEQDQVDGYMGKFWGVFMVPLMIVGLTLLFLAIPLIDPLKANIAKFRETFNAFIVMFVLFMVYVYGLTLAWNLGYTNFRFSSMLLPAMGLLFIFIGFMIRKAKRNYFIGIRTPWTLSNDEVWDKTHQLGGSLFIAAGVITLLGAFFPAQAFILLMVSIFGAALVPIAYSYLLWRKVEKGNL